MTGLNIERRHLCSRLQEINQCCYNAWPASQTMGQHLDSIDLILRALLACMNLYNGEGMVVDSEMLRTSVKKTLYCALLGLVCKYTF